MGTLIASIGGWLLSKVIGIASSGIVDKALDAFGRSQDGKTEITKEAMKTYVEMIKADADLNKAKLQMPWFGLCVGVFLGPLALYWSMTLLDSVFDFPTDVLQLPPKFEAWADDMIHWVFYVGSPVVAIKALMK